MAETHDNSVADPAETENATQMWGRFTEFMKWSVIAVIVVLILMAAFLL